MAKWLQAFSNQTEEEKSAYVEKVRQAKRQTWANKTEEKAKLKAKPNGIQTVSAGITHDIFRPRP